MLELVVQVRALSDEVFRALEEAFRRDGEKLGGIGGRVGAEHVVVAMVEVFSEFVVVACQDRGPGGVHRAAVEQGSSVSVAVF